MSIKYFDRTQLESFLKPRYGETKIGQKIDLIEDLSDLDNISQEFVIIGIPEDIGVMANHGHSGARFTWNAFLRAFLNTQENDYNSSNNLIILGNIDCDNEIEKLENVDQKNTDYHVYLSDLVQSIDNKVYQTLKRVFDAEKIPIIIGGGHNNAFGIIKAFHNSFDEPINVLNLDAHTDLRHMDYRHSGNAFSCALRENYLKKYFIFGLHENYTPDYVFKEIEKNKNIDFSFFDHLLHLNPLERLSKLKHANNFMGENFGLEIDCDSIAGFNSSAMSPSGFTVDQMRKMINFLKNNTLEYIHICEAIPDSEGQVGKALSYFVSDLLRE